MNQQYYYYLAIERGKEWLNDHKDHIKKLVDSCSNEITPTGEDFVRPELWKGIHWRWFLKETGVVI